MREFYSENKERIDRILFLILVTIAFYLFFTVFFVYLSPFFFGLLIALIMEPLNKLLARRIGFRRWVASLISLAVFIAIVGSLGAWLVGTLFRQVTSIAESAPTHIAEISERLDEANVRLQRFTVHLPEGWYIPNIEEMVAAAVGFFGGGMRDTGLRTLGGVGDFFLNVILGLVSAYFFMSDGKRIFQFVKDSCPQWVRGQMRQTKKGLTRAMSGYFRAQAILMVMVGIISIAGLMLLRSPYALLLGLLFAALDFLPILGPALVLLPWALISVIMGDMRQAIGLTVIWGIITIARQVLQPKILGTQMGAHPLASLMSIFIGFRIFGLFGLIIGPALLMIIIAIRDADKSSPTSSEK
jgi:sporulation integral membrane protein YtvI